MVTLCNRQLDRFIPDIKLQTYAQHDISSHHPADPVFSFGKRQASVVELAPQLPALLALSLALPQGMHSTHSMHSSAETEGEVCVQVVLLASMPANGPQACPKSSQSTCLTAHARRPNLSRSPSLASNLKWLSSHAAETTSYAFPSEVAQQMQQ